MQEVYWGGPPGVKPVRRGGSRIVQRESGTPVQLPWGLTLPVLSGVLELGWLFRDVPPLSQGGQDLILL